MGTRLRVVFSLLLALPLALLASSCGGSGTSNDSKGSVPVITIKRPSRTVTYTAPSSAMEPTLLCAKGPAYPGCTGVANDRVAVQEPAPRIHRQDIIVFRTPSKASLQCGEGGTFIKRVIGLPGETVREDDNGFIWIREPRSTKFAKLKEPYLTPERRLADTAHFGQEWHVPTDAYFTMGDNRASSCDSRSWGGVPGANVIGKVVKILRTG